MNIEKEILNIIATTTAVDVSELHPDQSLKNDLHISTVDLADIYTKIEEIFHLEIDAITSDEELDTIQDLIDYVTDHYEESSDF